MNRLKKYFVLALVLCCFSLCACTKTVEFAAGSITDDQESVTIVLQEGETALLDSLPLLKSADFSGSTCYEEIALWSKSHPDVAVTYTVALPDGQDLPYTATEADVVPGFSLEDYASAMKHLPQLSLIRAKGDFSPEEISTLTALFPDKELEFSIDVCGEKLTQSTEELDLSTADRKDIDRLITLLPAAKKLSHVDLGSESSNPAIGFEDIKALQLAAPGLDIGYSFELYGKQVELNDEKIDLYYTHVNDEGKKVIAAGQCMPKLTYVDMDSCGLSNQQMEVVRDALPNATVVWRIFFGGAYTVRTDTEQILASCPGMGGDLTDSNIEVLKYCTKVKRLDLGHNEGLTQMPFLQYMTELEIAILAMNQCSDFSGLANCPNLEYLEIQTTQVTDLSFLSGLKNLKHLNIGYNQQLSDITPLYPLTQLERLWIGCLDPVPAEQVAKMQECAPNCEINTDVYDPTDGHWRYVGYNELAYQTILHPRYQQLVDEMGYASFRGFCFTWNDPLYKP